MAGKNILLLITVTVITHTECSKLNVPRVLLPIFSEFSTNFTLEVTEGGCYKWTTSRLDLVQLIPIDSNSEQDCSSRVIVSTISKEQTRNTAIVLAEDIYTRQILRCDVIVDVISTLNIVTTTRELFMEEAPEAFEVRAYDDQGNEFTTLEGIEFDWSLSSPGSTVLRFITFRDSPYETPPTVQIFDEIGKQGHIILLEGVKTGSAKVSVRLPYLEYKNVAGIEVSLMVIANLIIEPADVYILRGDVVHYKIIQVKQGRLEEIKLPSAQYFLVSENSDIGFIEKNSGYLTGMSIGKTRVYLHDRNVNEKDSGLKPPSATVYVTDPMRITLSLLPHRNWAVLLGGHHDIAVEVFASNDHKIHLGEGVQLKTTVDDKYFKVSHRTTNGSWISGQVIETGVTEVQTSLISVWSTKLGPIDLNPKLTAKAEMLIFPKITLTPAEVILPWDPVVRPRYEIELKATGGDGKFMWSTTNHSVGVVTQSGLMRTLWHGKFETCASMTRNHHNRQCAKVHVLPPSRLEIVDFMMEAEVGSPIFLNIALYGDRPKPGGGIVKVPFTKCRELPFEVKATDHNFYYNESAVAEPVGISCTSVGVIGVTPGSSRITVAYNRDDIHLEKSVVVSAFRPLKLLQPLSGQTVLALGTSRFLIFTGGPRPWVGRSSEHVVQTESSNLNIIEAVDSSQKYKIPGGSDTYVINVACKDFGEATVTLKVFNKPLVPHCKCQESVATAVVVCAKPEFVYLRPEIKVANSASCPMDLSSEKVIVQSYRNIDLLVDVKDNFGRQFNNVSSLEFAWELNPSDLGTVMHKDGVFQKTFLEENVALPNKTYQVIVPQSQTGIIDVQATIVGYQASVLRQLKLWTVPKLTPVFTLISLYLVNDLIVLPNKTSVYNHQLNKQKLNIKQGSGYFEVSQSSDSIAEVKYNERLRQIEVTPKQTGELRVSVSDLCLMCSPVVVQLNIVHAASIRVEMPDRVEVGKSIATIVKFFDEFDNLMPLPKLEYLDVRNKMDDTILKLQLEEESTTDPWLTGEIHYIVTGLELGETKLIFAAGRGEKKIVSLPVDVQVFSPLRIFPRNATLMVGAVIQIHSVGGPQPDTNIEYKIESKNIADVSLHGIVHALNIGHTKITARSISVNPVTGRKVINSQDSVDIFVIPLIGIKLSTPLTRFVVGSAVPVWASGLPERLSPLILGSVEPPLRFSWGTRCSDVISLEGILHPLGINSNPQNKISVRVKGLRPGHCILELNVTMPDSLTGIAKILHTASIDMEVIEEFNLLAPSGFTGQNILIAPFSEMKLKTNKDGYTALHYSVHGEETVDVDDKSVSVDSVPVLTVSNNGVVKSYGITGRAMIVIVASDEYGLKQTLTIVVLVKPVHYMLLSATASWQIPIEENVNVLPVGSQIKLVTSFHDNTGAKFAAASCNLHFHTSRSDLIDVKRDVDNSTFNVYSLQEGATVLKVWAEKCLKTADFVQLYGGQTTLPKTNVVTSGDVLCLWSPVVDENRKPGKWRAEPEDVIVVNKNTGVGYVTSSKSTQVYITYDLTSLAKVTLDVEPITEISFVVDRSSILTNTPGTVFRASVLFRDAKNPSKKNNLYAGWQCHNLLEVEMSSFFFTCNIGFAHAIDSVSVWELFTVRPSFNRDLGLYSCDLIPSSEPSANTSTIESNITIQVVTENGVESRSLELQFIPAIYVSSKELIMDDSYFTASLSILGLPEVLRQVTVAAFDSSLLEVGPVKHISENMISYDIVLIDYHWKLEELKDPMSILVTSKLTHQNMKVQVKMNSDHFTAPFCAAGSPLGNFVYEHKQTLIIIFSMVVLLFVTFYAYSQYIQPVINVNVAPDRFVMLNSSTPYTSSPYMNRTLNTSGSPMMRFDTRDPMQDTRTRGNSPELRRNKRFL